MAGKKPAMGKGIDAILGGAESSLGAIRSAVDEIHSGAPIDPPLAQQDVDITLIDVNPYNPRVEFDPAALEELAESVQRYGIVQPLTVRKKGERYELIAGERRLRASKEAGLTRVPVHIVDLDEKEMREVALVENLQREDLNALEVALAFETLIEAYDLSHDDLAARMGMNRATVANFLRLLKLPASVQVRIRAKEISQGHARALLGLEDAGMQEKLAQDIVEQGLSVRMVEALVRRLNESPAQGEAGQQSTQPTKIKPVEDYVESMQQELYDVLGYGAQLRPGKGGTGKVVISYRSEGERKELMEKLSRLK